MSRSDRKKERLAGQKRVGVISLGCPKNLVDTEVMLGHLDNAGYEFIQDPEEADVILINTCSFIESAREESIQTILEAAKLKTDRQVETSGGRGLLDPALPGGSGPGDARGG